MDSEPTELISYDGEFKENDLEKFISSVKLDECGVSYKVVAIMGAQNTGKSTLLNYVFGTKFTEGKIRQKATTKGVWISKAQQEPFTLVLDLEGTDGRDRGENDTTFEKQSALFALVFADIILINMWDRAFDTVHGASRPLLRTIFEVAITMESFTRRKTTLFYVFRDTMPFDQSMKSSVIEDVEEIWKDVRGKPEGDENALLSEFFNVEFYALPIYRLEQEVSQVFEEEVAKLGKKISDLRSAGLAAVPASGFCLTAKTIWENIKENKDLDLPSVKVMVATVRCEQIAEDKLRDFANNQQWLAVRNAAETRFISGFSATIRSILDISLSQYDSASKHYVEGVRNGKRQYLESETLRLVHPVYTNILGHLRQQQFQRFKNQLENELSSGGGFAQSSLNCKESCVLEFDQQCSDSAIEQARWDASTVRTELLLEIQSYVTDQYRTRLFKKLRRDLSRLFTAFDEEITWAYVRRLLRSTLDQMVNDLTQEAREMVENKFKDEKTHVLAHMKNRCLFDLARESTSSQPRDNKAIRRATEEAYRKCLKLLSTMAVLRFDGKDEDDDVVEPVLVSALMDGDRVSDDDPLASNTWKEIPAELTLITPRQCKDIWEQFKREMGDYDYEANAVEETCKKETRWSPPRWVIVALFVLGIAGFIAFLRFTNMDLVLLSAFAVKGVAIAVKGVAIAGAAIQIGVEGMALYRNFAEHREKGNNTTLDAINGFRTRHNMIFTNLERALREFYEYMTNSNGRKSRITA